MAVAAFFTGGVLWAGLWEPRRDAGKVVVGDNAEDCDCPTTPTTTPTLIPTAPPAATPTPAPTPVYFTCARVEAMGAQCVWEDSQNLLIVLGNEVTHFDTARDTLKPQGYTRLREFNEVLLEFPELNIRISGHTDIRGSRAMNQDLSERRAYRVRNTIVGMGLPFTAVGQVTGHAFDKPVGDNNTIEGRARNRRTEIRLTFTAFAWNYEKGRLEPLPAQQAPPDQTVPDRLDTETIDDGRVDPASHGLPGIGQGDVVEPDPPLEP
jgi:outer membrane protein OmpA-like peptidoglycan-associated protein